MGQRWLVVSYFAHIDAMAPSHHIDDRLPVFRDRGVEVSLLSSPCGPRYEGLTHLRICSPAPSGIRYETRYFLRQRTKSRFWFKFWETLLLLPVYPFYFMEKLLLRLDSTWSWFITSSFAVFALALWKRPDVIYSTGGPVSGHLAAMAASRLLGIPHIAEFQDPLVHQYAAPGKFERHFIKSVERMILRTAAAGVFLTGTAARNAANRNQGARTTAVYAGAIPGQGGGRYEGGGQMKIAHFGSLGGSRNLEVFLDALGSLIREQPETAGLVRLELYGNTSREVAGQIERFPFPNVIHAHGKVRRSESLAGMARADVLLLIQNTDDVSFETVPSKVYEYLHTGRPVLGLVFRNPELHAMLRDLGHLSVEADDPAAVREATREYFTAWREGRLPVPVHSPYTVERAVGELMEISGQAAGRSGA